MRSMGLAAMTVGSIYLWLHFRGLPVFKKLNASNGTVWVVSAVLSAALLLVAVLNTVLTGFYLYLCLCYLLTDFIWFVMLLTGRDKRPWRAWRRIYLGGITAIALAALISVYGYFNACNIVTTKYDMGISKPGLPDDGLRIVLIADTHLGSFLHGEDMFQLVEQINAHNPDLVLLVGDIYEESSSVQDISESLHAFSGFRSTYGAYFVPGNHEYYADRKGLIDLSELYAGLREAGVIPLKDETVSLGNFLLVGRDDATVSLRKPLEELLQGVDPMQPVIVLDHQPRDVEEASKTSADLQLSGHTHAGQLFPAGQLARISGVFPVIYGLHSYGSYHIIVSSGAGVWGFPVRVGSPSEVVLITLKSA